MGEISGACFSRKIVRFWVDCDSRSAIVTIEQRENDILPERLEKWTRNLFPCTK